MSKPVPVRAHRPLLLIMGLSLLVMLWAATDYFRSHPGLTVHIPASAPAVSESGASGTPSGNAPSASSQDQQQLADTAPTGQQDGVMRLMQQLQKNPDDVAALTALAQHFLHLEDWNKAENFALRATMAASADPVPLHLLGIVQHSQGRHLEAASNLEKSLQLKNDPSTHYSAGILYLYFLKNIPKATSHLKQVLDSPAAPDDLKQHATAELEKIIAGTTETVTP